MGLLGILLGLGLLVWLAYRGWSVLLLAPAAALVAAARGAHVTVVDSDGVGGAAVGVLARYGARQLIVEPPTLEQLFLSQYE